MSDKSPYTWVLASDKDTQELRWHHIEDPKDKDFVLLVSKQVKGEFKPLYTY